MREFLIRYIDALIPLVGSILILCFPQLLTKVDLKADEHQATARKLKYAGYALLAAAACIGIASAMSTK